jgi:GNAT superfamily N-acetyltransferase
MIGARRVREIWKGHVYHLQWFSGAIPPVTLSNPTVWRCLSPAETEQWVAAHPGGSETSYERRIALENRHLLMVAEVDGRAVAQRWIARGWSYLSRPIAANVRFPPGMGHFYSRIVDPAFRGRGIGRSGVCDSLALAREAGLTHCSGQIDSWNAASLRNWMDLGIPAWRVTRVIARNRGVWIPSSPWARLGVDRVEPVPSRLLEPRV